MTKAEREKAIDLLDNLLGMIEDNQGNDYDFALKMGIEALKQEPKESKDIHLPLYKVGDRIEPGTDGYAYKFYMSNGKEFEEQPCEDAVSRQAVRDGMVKYGFHAPDMTITEFVEDVLPLGTPTCKKGKWIKTGQSFINPNKFLCYSCSECGSDSGKVKTKFCSNCGAEMKSEL